MNKEDFKIQLSTAIKNSEPAENKKTKKSKLPNSLSDLNNYLFEELERLNDDETLLNDNNLEKEIKRSKAITNIAQTIINNANTVLEAQKFIEETGKENVPTLLIE